MASLLHMSSPHPAHARAEAAVDPADGGLDDAAIGVLTARVAAGEAAAYEALFRARCRFVEEEAARRLGRRADLADDVAQETWIRVGRWPRRCEGAGHLDGWLRSIVRSVAIDILRSELARRCREQEAAMSRTEAVAFLDDHDILEEIRREAAECAGISAEERSLLELQVRTGATVARLAAWLGIGRTALDSRLRRAAERARAQRYST